MFEHLDYVYMPSRDVAADVTYFTEVLGGRLVFAIDGMGTRVAMVALTEESPRILLAGHLDGDVPVLVYRVDDLDDGDGRSQVTWLEAGSHAGDPARARSVRSPLRAVSGWPSTSCRGRASRRASSGGATSDVEPR